MSKEEYTTLYGKYLTIENELKELCKSFATSGRMLEYIKATGEYDDLDDQWRCAELLEPEKVYYNQVEFRFSDRFMEVDTSIAVPLRFIFDNGMVT